MIDIQPQHVTLTTLFQGRLFRIPQYQRSYSWQSKQRQDLFNDINQVDNHGADRSHFMATVAGLRREELYIGTTAHRFIEIVDGQQRITTLILLLKAIAATIDDTTPNGSQVREEINDLLIKDDKATLLLLQTNHDSSDYFATYLKNGTHRSKEDARTAADRELLAAIEECTQFVSGWQTSGKALEHLVILIKNRLTFIFHEISDEATVYTVFEVLNSRGLDVSWFDRLKSMLMAIVFERADNRVEIINDVHSLWTEIYNCVGLRLDRNTESLRFAAALQATEMPSRLLGEEDAALLLRKQSEESAEQVIETTRWLRDVTMALHRVVADPRKNAVTTMRHARLVATAIHMRDDFKKSEKEKILNRWENVTFRIYGMFRRDARSAVGEYVRLGWRIVNERLSSEAILAELSEIGRKYPIGKAVELLRNTDRYTEWGEGLRYFLYRYEEHLTKEAGQTFNNEQWARIWEIEPRRSIEHIRPQNWWISRGRESEKDIMHGLGNLLLLPPRLNSRLQDKDPREKADDYTKTGLLLAQEVAETVSESGWNGTTMRARQARLLKWAKQEWGD